MVDKKTISNLFIRKVKFKLKYTRTYTKEHSSQDFSHQIRIENYYKTQF